MGSRLHGVATVARPLLLLIELVVKEQNQQLLHVDADQVDNLDHHRPRLAPRVLVQFARLVVFEQHTDHGFDYVDDHVGQEESQHQTPNEPVGHC